MVAGRVSHKPNVLVLQADTLVLWVLPIGPTSYFQFEATVLLEGSTPGVDPIPPRGLERLVRNLLLLAIPNDWLQGYCLQYGLFSFLAGWSPWPNRPGPIADPTSGPQSWWSKPPPI